MREKQAVEVLERVAEGVRRAMKDIRRYVKEHPDFERAGTHLIKTFGRGVERSILK